MCRRCVVKFSLAPRFAGQLGRQTPGHDSLLAGPVESERDDEEIASVCVCVCGVLVGSAICVLTV